MAVRIVAPCWFNAKNKGEAGCSQVQESERDFCTGRGLPGSVVDFDYLPPVMMKLFLALGTKQSDAGLGLIVSIHLHVKPVVALPVWTLD